MMIMRERTGQHFRKTVQEESEELVSIVLRAHIRVERKEAGRFIFAALYERDRIVRRTAAAECERGKENLHFSAKADELFLELLFALAQRASKTDHVKGRGGENAVPNRWNHEKLLQQAIHIARRTLVDESRVGGHRARAVLVIDDRRRKRRPVCGHCGFLLVGASLHRAIG